MAANWFLIEGPRVIPVQFHAWECAEIERNSLFNEFCAALEQGVSTADLEERTRAATHRAKQLEEVALNAYRDWLRSE